MTTASNARTVHILPRGKPVGSTTAHLTSFSGSEDTPLVLQVAGMNDLGLCMQAVITTLPSKGKLFAVSTGCESPPKHLTIRHSFSVCCSLQFR